MDPIPINNPDFTDLIDSALEYIEFIDSENYHEDSLDDYKQEIFEIAMEAVFGPKIWDWINERT